MGRAGKDDLHLRSAPLTAVVDEAAEPHADRGKTLHLRQLAPAGGAAAPPVILRRPEIIHGLRNLIQNAVDFAESARLDRNAVVRHATSRCASWMTGRAFPPHLLGRIGDPLMRRRRARRPDAAPGPEYEGMGLGLFIAKTLLERSGADLSFANGLTVFKAIGKRERTRRRRRGGLAPDAAGAPR